MKIQNKHKCPLKDWRRLTSKEKKIYNSVKDSFSATSHECALDIAIQGGIKFQFIPT